MKQTIAALAILAGLTGLLLLACGSDGSDGTTLGSACQIDTDCQGGERCLNSHCRSLTCSTNLDCLGGEYCNIPLGSLTGQCQTANLPDGDTTPADGDADPTDTDPDPEPEKEPDLEPTGVCDPGETRCNGDDLQACELRNGQFYDWVFDSACGHGCNAETGLCIEPACTPGERFCNRDTVGPYIEECQEDGMGFTEVERCAGGACVENTGPDDEIVPECETEPVCQPGMKSCCGGESYCNGKENAIATCNDAGTGWKIYNCWDGSVCDNAQCLDIPTTCQANRYRCNNNSVERCATDGSAWAFVEACAEGSTCRCNDVNECTLANCETGPECTMGQKRCSPDGTKVEMCTGYGWFPLETCAEGTVCSGAACL